MGEKSLDLQQLEAMTPASEEVRSLREADSSVAQVSNLTDADVVALSVDSFPPSVPLPCSVYLKVNNKYVPFRGVGERLTPKRLMELTARGASSFYLQEKTWKLFCDFMEKSGPTGGDPKEKASYIRQMMLVYGRELERRNREQRKLLFEKMQKHSFDLAGIVKSNPQLAGEMLSRAAQPGGHFPGHSLNTAVYAGLIGVRLKFSNEDLKILVYGAMVHDAGKLTLDKRVLTKLGELTKEELQLVQSHPRAGAEMMQSYVSTPAVILTAMQHHERFDGNGYPNKLKGEQIHPFARICAIADAFDSLTSDRPHRPKVSAQEALQKMAADTGHFDGKYLTAIPGQNS